MKWKWVKSPWYMNVYGDKPITITYPKTNFSIDYNADAWGLTRKNEIDVYEVLDSEMGDRDALVANITQAAISAKWLGLICRRDEDEDTRKKLNEVDKIAEVIIKNIQEKSSNKMIKDGYELFEVPSDIVRSKEMEKELFREMFDQRYLAMKA